MYPSLRVQDSGERLWAPPSSIAQREQEGARRTKLWLLKTSSRERHTSLTLTLISQSKYHVLWFRLAGTCHLPCTRKRMTRVLVETLGYPSTAGAQMSFQNSAWHVVTVLQRFHFHRHSNSHWARWISLERCKKRFAYLLNQHSSVEFLSFELNLWKIKRPACM